MKTTLYVALERLIDMSEASDWKLDESLYKSLSSHRTECKFVAAFAPHRFGLFFESSEEVDEAWNYIRTWLSNHGLKFEEKCVTLHSDGDISEFNTKETSWWLANEADQNVLASNLRIVDTLPEANTISQRLKNMFAAVLF